MRKNGGFTLIEVLIVVAISAMLAGIAISYSGAERNQTALSVAETEISQFILQARSLAIATYSNAEGSACGYGVSFNASDNTYSIFAYVPGGSACPQPSDITSAPTLDSEKLYTDETWKVHLQNGVTFSMSSSSALSSILFIPPDPATLLFDGSGNLASQGSVNLVTVDGTMSRTISVDSAGQVNF
jgi:prepilin-type N-terminal cleavage/methylation domain-containing protein